MKIVLTSRIVFCAMICAVCASAEAETVDLTKKYPTCEAKIVKAHDVSGKPLMYSGNGKTARIVKKAKVTQTAAKKAAIAKKNAKAAENLNPEVAGAKKLTMQDYNRYAYRKSNSAKPNVPVTKAAGGEFENNVKK